jgi:hypothetical protein
MGSHTKSARADSGRLYGTLLRAYPLSFRQHYGTSMQQTFNDMLHAEPSRAARLVIWARALLDLPLSASKEHITNGKDIIMNRTTKYIIAAALGAILIVGAGSFLFGSLHAKQTKGVERVTISQLNTVTRSDNATLVTFATGRPYSLTCQFASTLAVRSGQTIAVAAPAGSAERQPHGVLLHNCLQN